MNRKIREHEEQCIEEFNKRIQGKKDMKKRSQRLVKDQLRGVVNGDFRNAAAFSRGAFFGFPFGVKPVSERDFPSVFDQELRIEVMSVKHANIAVKLVKASLVGIVPRRRIADTPFAKATGFVAGLPQKSGHGEVLRS